MVQLYQQILCKNNKRAAYNVIDRFETKQIIERILPTLHGPHVFGTEVHIPRLRDVQYVVGANLQFTLLTVVATIFTICTTCSTFPEAKAASAFFEKIISD